MNGTPTVAGGGGKSKCSGINHFIVVIFVLCLTHRNVTFELSHSYPVNFQGSGNQ